MARETSVTQEDDAHLQPGFDPSTLRVPQLRGLLLEYTNDQHAGVKKPELVKAYKTLVQPRAAAILAARAGVTPSGRGIQHISNNSSQASSVESMDAAAAQEDGIDDTEMAELPVKRTRTASGAKAKPRKSAAPALPTSRSRRSLAVPRINVPAQEDAMDEDIDEIEEPVEDEPAPVVVPAKRPRGRPPKSPKPLNPQPSSDPPAPPSTKKPAAFYEVPKQDSPPQVVISKPKGRKSTSALPIPAREEVPEMPKDDSEPEGANESGFSDWNPFQGGDDSGDGPSKKKRRKSSLAPSELADATSPRKSGLSSSKSMSAIADRRSSVRKPRSSLAVSGKESPTHETPSSLFSSQAFADTPAPEPEVDYQEPYQEPAPAPPKKRSPGRPRKSAIFGNDTPQSIPKSQSVPQFTKYMDVSSVQATPEHVRAMMRQVSGEQGSSGTPNKPSPPAMSSLNPAAAPQGGSRSPSPKRLAAQRSESTQVAVQPEPTPKKQRKSFPAQSNEKQMVVAKPGSLAPVKTFAWLPVLLIVMSYLGWYRNERLAVGYCDSGSDTNVIQASRHITAQAAAPDALATIEHSNALDTYHLRPTCMPCPVEGICTEGQLVSCGNSHIRKQNFWKAATVGIIPAGDDCVPDTEKQIRIAHLAVGLHSKLRERRGEVECYKHRHGKAEKALDDVVWYGVKVDDLRSEMSKIAGISKIPPEERLEYFEAALADLEKHREIEQVADADGVDYVASLQADLPLTCRMRKTTYHYANERKKELSGTFSIIAAIYYLREKRRKDKATEQRARELVDEVYRVLRSQESAYYTDPVSISTPYVGKIQLRDDLLADEYSTATKKELWKKVSKIIEANSNVRSGEKEIKGETLPTWQWTGAQATEYTPGRRTPGPRKSGLAQGSLPRSASRRHVTFNETAEDEEGNTSVYPKLE